MAFLNRAFQTISASPETLVIVRKLWG